MDIEEDPPPEETTCLKCRKKFLSRNRKTNRICDGCSKKNRRTPRTSKVILGGHTILEDT